VRLLNYAAVRLGVLLDGGAALLAINLHVAALLGLRITAVEAFKQVSSSMAPTLAASDARGSTSCRCTGTRSSAAISSCSGTRASRLVGDIKEKLRKLRPGATFRTAAREPHPPLKSVATRPPVRLSHGT